MTYRREVVNRVNLRRGIRKLNRLGVRPKGVGSPYGFWFKGYQEAVRKLGFAYSSEFAFNSDDVPCFPCNDIKYPLQVPVHVGSIGVFEKAGFSRKEMFTHLRGTMEKAIQDCGCALLCDHPIGRIEKYEEGFIELLREFLHKGCRCVTLSDYAEEFRGFLRADFEPFAAGRSILIEGPDSDSGSFEVILPERGHYEAQGPWDGVFHSDLQGVVDDFEPPPRTEFDRFLHEHDKDQSLTHLTLSQWYRGLARFHWNRLRNDARKFSGRMRLPR
jgi:hypothetical protein